MKMLSSSLSVGALVLEPQEEPAENTSSEEIVGEDSSEVFVEDDSPSDIEGTSSVESVSSSDAPIIIMGSSSYDDSQLVAGISEINSRLERINSNLEDNNVMVLWGLIIAVGVLLSYLFYSIAKKFI